MWLCDFAYDLKVKGEGLMGSGKRVILLSLSLCACFCSSRVCAEELEFDFKDPKGVNTIAFILDSVWEPIMGLTSGISGKVTFDPAKPKAMHGRLVVEATEVRCALPAMTSVLHSKDWLDVKNYPTIEFSFKQVKSAKSVGKDVTELTVAGDFTCKGVTKEILVSIKATYLPGLLKKRLRGTKGDMLVLRTSFTFKRSDYGIKPAMGPETVADDIELRVSIVGVHPEK